MNEKDKLKLEHLKDTFRKNFKITRLYKAFLENFPHIIKKEAVLDLTADGSFTKEEITVALLSQVFSLDMEKSEEDRQLILNYLTPSVKILNPKKYEDNSYYKNIKIDNIKSGSWEYRRECYKAYKGFIRGDMMLLDNFREVPPLGFFEEDFYFPAVLENGNEWMTLTPVDIDTCDEAIEQAHGKVITFGLGLGYYAYAVSQKDSVDSVTVIEKSPEVIKLFKEYILNQFPHKEKVKIIESDAFVYAEKEMPKERYDYAFVDTWRDAGDGEEMYRKMKSLEHLSEGTEFSYWIENFLISRVRALKYQAILEKADKDDFSLSYEDIVKELEKI